MAELLLLVEFASKLCDVGREIPLDMERGRCLLLFQSGHNTPFSAQMLEDPLYGLGSVANVVVVEFFDVRGIDGFAYYLVNDDDIDLVSRTLGIQGCGQP